MRTAIIFALLFFAPAMGLSATIYVPDDYAKIQDAVVASVNGDIVIVRPGTYVENIDFIGKAITLKSEMGPGVTIIDGNQAGSVVSFQSGETQDSILEGFTVTNGSGTYFSLYDEFNGGGIVCDVSSPTISGNIITGNEIRDVGAGIFCIEDFAIIDENVITGNIAHGSGGGLYLFRSNATISGNTISSNTSDRSGGGFRCRLSTLTVIDNAFRDNSAAMDGGAISFLSKSTGLIANNIITGNSTGNDGGGIFCISSSPAIESNIVTDNYADDDGGGIYFYSFSSTITNNIIANNQADAEGGGIQNIGSEYSTTSNTIYGNIAQKGGGISCLNTTLTANNMILWDNSATTGPEIWIASPPSSLAINFSDVKGDQSSVVMEPGSTLIWGAAMINADPLFFDAANHDFHLTFDSPCRNTGNNLAPSMPDTDFEGDPRIAADVTDMGADEFYHHLYCTGDVVPEGNIDIIVIGTPGVSSQLYLGSGIRSTPKLTGYGYLYVKFPIKKSWDLGDIPATGIISWSVTVPSNAPSGKEYPLQALVGPLGESNSRLTNLLVLTVE